MGLSCVVARCLQWLRHSLGAVVHRDRPKMPPEIRAAFDRALAVDPPMPSDDAPDDVWDSWIDLQGFHSIMAGWPDRTPERWLADLTSALASPGVRAYLGDAVGDAMVAGRWIAETTPGDRGRSQP